jgi:hypothetical protein
MVKRMAWASHISGGSAHFPEITKHMEIAKYILGIGLFHTVLNPLHTEQSLPKLIDNIGLFMVTRSFSFLWFHLH